MEAKAIDGWGMWSGGFRLWECQSMLVSSFEVRKEAGTGVMTLSCVKGAGYRSPVVRLGLMRYAT